MLLSHLEYAMVLILSSLNNIGGIYISALEHVILSGYVLTYNAGEVYIFKHGLYISA